MEVVIAVIAVWPEQKQKTYREWMSTFYYLIWIMKDKEDE